ncbi:hypothetical protein [Magnetospirillum sulfuroxidans]|uniref:Uncharacterized protein n=1 Tax=Magnetospirillum sulfuroxidans TaxID=611300 RepID=A0ABS5I8S1_9PROT|nr:hypothetical protein [Magnetospirillum sulfuroxidans]MBR9970805.1 hypothetical protein [Magnetospirillum sulfuroxidans]
MAEHIQINDVTPRIIYTANGTQAAFTYPFAIFKAADLEVYLDGVKQVSGFTVAGAGSSSGGTATFAAAPAAAVQVTLRRQIAIARTSDYQADGIIRAKTLNDELDYQVAAIQQVAEDASRAIKRSATSASIADLTLPDPVAGKAIGWNADATGLTNDPADFAGTVATVMAQAGIATTAATTAGGHAGTAGSQAGIATTQAGNAAASAAAALASEAAAQDYAAAADVAKVEWQGAWDGATAYAVRDAVSHAGSSWICIEAHTNQVPADNAYWDVLAAKGVDGAGTGDMMAASNLADLTNPAAARTNLDVYAKAASDALYADRALSNLTDAAAARASLGVSSAAQVDDAISGVAAHIDALKTNLAMTILRMIANAGSSYMGMVAGWADEFENLTGITSLGGATYDAAGDCIHNSGTVTTASSSTEWSGGTGDWTFPGDDLEVSANDNFIYTVDDFAGDFAFSFTYKTDESNISLVGVFASASKGSVNTNASTQSFAGWFWDRHSANNFLANNRTIGTGGTSDSSATSAFVNNDVCTFRRVGSTLSVERNGTTVYTFATTSSATLCAFVSQANGSTGHFLDVSWTVPGSPLNATVTSITRHADASPTQGRVTLVVDPQVAVTYGTDNRIRMSHDGGTTWVTGTMAVEAVNLDFPGGYTVDVVTAAFDFTGTPSGTSMQVEWSTFNNKHQLLHAWYPEWRV